MAKVLIVDDDPDVVEACKIVLEAEGYDVATATSRPEGLKRVDEFKPDLLVLDVMMEQPDDGIAMAQELRKNQFKSPILMVTSLGKVTGLDYDKDESIVPVDAFLEKPLHPRAFLSKVGELLDGKEN